MKITLQKSDTLGALASTLCFIHCLVTPFIFIAKSSTYIEHHHAPLWWKSLDYLFLVISLFAVKHSTKNSSKKIMIPLFWVNWGVLVFVIINEKIGFISLPEIITYITALTLACLHIYNLKFCQCKNDKCCTSNE